MSLRILPGREGQYPIIQPPEASSKKVGALLRKVCFAILESQWKWPEGVRFGTERMKIDARNHTSYIAENRSKWNNHPFALLTRGLRGARRTRQRRRLSLVESQSLTLCSSVNSSEQSERVVHFFILWVNAPRPNTYPIDPQNSDFQIF